MTVWSDMAEDSLVQVPIYMLPVSFSSPNKNWVKLILAEVFSYWCFNALLYLILSKITPYVIEFNRCKPFNLHVHFFLPCRN